MLRSAFRPHDPVRKQFLLPSRTQQSFKDETDINSIMAKYQKTGLIDHVNEHGAHYGEQPAADDYHAAMNMVASTSSLFSELPSSVRDEFDNDPALFLEYISDEERRNELLKTKKINQDELDIPAVPEADPPPNEPDPGD